MPRFVKVHQRGSPGSTLVIARWCESFFCRLRGLMFRRELPGGAGLVLVEKREGITNTSIHMFAVPFPIGVLWVNARQEIVDKVVARPWRIYSPAEPARFIVEGPPAMIDGVSQGDLVEFRPHDPI